MISGKMGAGKDTLAAKLIRGVVMPGYVNCKFGLTDPVKLEIAQHFGADLNVLHGTAEQKAARLPNSHGDTTYRDALRILVGAYDYLEPGHLVRLFMARIDGESRRWSMKCFVVSNDIRRVRDANMLKSYGARFIRLTRSSPLVDQHHTETELDSWNGFDVVIDNRHLEPEETRAEAVKALTSWGWMR